MLEFRMEGGHVHNHARGFIRQVGDQEKHEYAQDEAGIGKGVWNANAGKIEKKKKS